MPWARNGTPSTLTAVSDTIEVLDMTGKKFNQILTNLLNSGSLNSDWTINSDSGSNYAYRTTTDGSADVPVATAVEVPTLGTVAFPSFTVIYLVGIVGDEKLAIQLVVGQGTAGESNAPTRMELVAKYVPVNLNDTIDAFTIINSGTGDFVADTQLLAMGTD